MNRNVIAVVPDMFFASKLRATAEDVGVNISFSRNRDALINALQNNKPDLVIVDLQATSIDPFAVARDIRAVEQLQDLPMLGFFSHVLTELQQQAREAGYTHVLPRSAFVKKLPEILTGQDF